MEEEVVVKEKKKNGIIRSIRKMPSFVKKIVVGVLIVIAIAIGIKLSYGSTHRETILDFGFRNVGVLVTQEWYGRVLEDSTKDRKLFEKIHIPFTNSRIIFSLDIIVSASVDFTKIEPHYYENKVVVELPHAEVYQPHQVPNTYISYLDDESWFRNISGTERHELEDAMIEKATKQALESGLLEKADNNAKTLIEKIIRAQYNDIEIEWKYKE